MKHLVIPVALFNDEPVPTEVVFNDAEVGAYETRLAALEAMRGDAPDEKIDAEIAKLGPAPDPVVEVFDLLPVTPELEGEFQKRRGQDEHEIRVLLPSGRRKPGEDDEDDGGFRSSVEFEPIVRKFSNEREVAAYRWLVCKIVRGWRPLRFSDGTVLEFSQKNLERLAASLQFSKPIARAGYRLAEIRSEATEGN